MASINDFINQWQKALTIEANDLESKGGIKTVITEGKCLTTDDTGATYWFLVHTDLFLPDGTPVRVEYHNQVYSGIVLSVEGFDVVIKINDFLGNDVKKAELYSAPWELLIALSKRLDSVKADRGKQKRVHRLLSPITQVKHPKDKIKNDVTELILRAKYNPVTYVWGPPGTGKTYILARMAAYLYKKGLKILILAHSNAAVDVLMLEVAAYLKGKNQWKSGDVLRYGYSHNQQVREQNDLLIEKMVEKSLPNLGEQLKQLEQKRLTVKRSYTYLQGEKLAKLENQLRKIRSGLKHEEERYVSNAKVLGVTLSKVAMDPLIYEGTYDLIIVDEASMAYTPQIAYVASLGKHTIVCGDFKQLPPIAMANHTLVDKWLKRDIFDVAKIVQSVSLEEAHPNLFMLTKQRRMHPDISRFTNQFIYQNKVSDHPSVRTKREPVAAKHPFVNEAAVQIDLSNMGAYALRDASSTSRFNLFSALIALQLILSAKMDGLESIGYITPYRAQSRLVNTFIREFFPDNRLSVGSEKIVAATVHKFQGSERDFVLFDAVDSYPESRAGKLLTGADSEKLINVAVTRARGKFIHVVDKKYMDSRTSKNNTIQQLSNHLERIGHSYTRFNLREIVERNYHANLQWFVDSNIEPLLEDMKQAKKIVISVPYPLKINRKRWDLLKSLENKIDIDVITLRQAKIPLRRFRIVHKDLVMPFIQINDERLWVGAPSIFDTSPQLPSFTCRLVSKQVVELFHSYLNLTPAKKVQDVVKKNVTSYRPTYTFSQYVATWDQCPRCHSVREIGTKKDGSFSLNCDYCGMKASIQDWYLQKYIDYAELKCRNCESSLEVEGSGNELHVTCHRCRSNVEVALLI